MTSQLDAPAGGDIMQAMRLLIVDDDLDMVSSVRTVMEGTG
jgi:hypothetical protein